MKAIHKFIEEQINRRNHASVIVSDNRELKIVQRIGFRSYTFDGKPCSEAFAEHVIANRFNPESIAGSGQA